MFCVHTRTHPVWTRRTRNRVSRVYPLPPNLSKLTILRSDSFLIIPVSALPIFALFNARFCQTHFLVCSLVKAASNHLKAAGTSVALVDA
ncbi:unnamed protein product [Rodentolepis nana]|uniref:Uncharacterized protein n=1 Tax=Rodentolepis nana TaxID=102285 RepID=A0A0R3U0U7_RODNA|nr:unnamed protein product [Rodentolepis nana]